MPDAVGSLLDRFEGRRIENATFRHRDHIQVAFEMLDRYEFSEACIRYASTIRAMAAGDGAPEKYNATITFAFMSLIAERKAAMAGDTLGGFFAANQDLLDKGVLKLWYTDERLTSETARRQFLLPDKIAGSPS